MTSVLVREQVNKNVPKHLTVIKKVNFVVAIEQFYHPENS